MRPRQFDEDEVLHIAFDQFWRKGVRGTSLTDIARDAGVQRGSLYNAYGSKEELFLRAYERYAAEYVQSIEAALAEGSLRDRLENFYGVAIANFCAGSPSRGCPTTRALMELSSVAEHGLSIEARKAFARLLDQILDRLTTAFAHGVAMGEYGKDPGAAAEQVLTVARGLVVLERAYGDEERLHRIARQTIDFVLD